MAKTLTKYLAEDGTEFDNEVDADAHDAALAESKQFDDYIAAAGLEKAQAGLMRKHLPQFLAFINDGIPPAVEPKLTEAEKAEKKAAREAKKAAAAPAA